MSERIGALLINLGTPGVPESGAVRRYRAQFLSDPRVVDMPSPLWKPILHGLVLRIRLSKSSEAYASIWHEKGSPRDQARILSVRVGRPCAPLYSLARFYLNPIAPPALNHH